MQNNEKGMYGKWKKRIIEEREDKKSYNKTNTKDNIIT